VANDGHLRSMDVTRLETSGGDSESGNNGNVVFDSLYYTKGMLSSLDVTPNGNLCWFGDNSGALHCVDARMAKSSSSAASVGSFMAHSKRVNNVHLHPKCEHLLVSSSRDARVNLFDTRMMRTSDDEQSIKPINSLRHLFNATSAFFSPISGNKIVSTSWDDSIAVWNDFLTSSKPSDETDRIIKPFESEPQKVLRISKYNQSGKWIASFKAMVRQGKLFAHLLRLLVLTTLNVLV